MKGFILDLRDLSAEVKEKKFDLVEIFSTLAVVLTPFLSFFEQISNFINETIGNNGVWLGGIFIIAGFYLSVTGIRRKESIEGVVHYQYVQTKRIIAKISFLTLIILTVFYLNFSIQYFKPLPSVIEGHLLCSDTQLPASNFQLDIVNKKGESVLVNQFFVTDESGYFTIYSEKTIKRGYFLVFTGNNGIKKQVSLKKYKSRKSIVDDSIEKVYFIPNCS